MSNFSNLLNLNQPRNSSRSSNPFNDMINDINNDNQRDHEHDNQRDSQRDSESNVNVNNALDSYLDYIRFSRHSLSDIIDIIRLQELHLYRVLNTERNHAFINSNETRNNIRNRLQVDSDIEDDEMDVDDPPSPVHLTRQQRHNQMNENSLPRPRTSRGILNPIVRRPPPPTRRIPRQTLRPRTLSYSQPVLSFSNIISDASINSLYTELLNNLTPVRVRPTTEQINIATDVVRFSNISNPLNSTCPITQESFDPDNIVTQIIQCGHIFNSVSLDRWFEQNTS